MAERTRPKRPGQKLVQAYVPAEIVNRFKAAANLEDRTITELLIEFMKAHADKVLKR